ncbi:transposase [Streptomyces sp. NPDC014995]|uniref:transposase n=1 Tax=Streptomyces sp. NPDC014995 TaxID=3364936 RepID=UPI0036F4EE84
MAINPQPELGSPTRRATGRPLPSAADRTDRRRACGDGRASHRDGIFEPKIVKKRQRWLAGVDKMVISLAVTGLTTGEAGPTWPVSTADVSRQTISTITDKVLDSMAAWQAAAWSAPRTRSTR